MTDLLGSKLFDCSNLMDATFRNLLAMAISCSVNDIIMNLADFEMADNVYGIAVFSLLIVGWILESK